jgi:hypothetical protein
VELATGGADEVLAPGRVDEDARVAFRIRAAVVRVPGEAMVAQMVTSDIGEGDVAPAFENQHPLARLGEHGRRNPATGTRPDDDRVVAHQPVTRKPTISHATGVV